MFATNATASSIPHACGGEPGEGSEMDEKDKVFPTRVGVNRGRKW